MSAGEPSPDLTARVTDLELRWMEQQDLVEQLSELIREQQRDITALKAAISSLRERVDAVGDDSPPHERPPHY